MDVTIQGTVLSSRPEGGTSNQGKAWQKQVLLIQTTEQQNNVYEVDCFQDAMVQAQTVGVGMPVTVVARVKSRQGKPNPQTGAVRYFLGLSAKSVQGMGMQQPMGQPMQPQYQQPQQPQQPQYQQAAPAPTYATPPPPQQPQYQPQQPQQPQYAAPAPVAPINTTPPVATTQQNMAAQNPAVQQAVQSTPMPPITAPGQPVHQHAAPAPQGQLPLSGAADDDLPF